MSFNNFLSWYNRVCRVPRTEVKNQNYHKEAALRLYSKSEHFLKMLPVREDSVVVELGPGYGFHTSFFSERCFQVVCYDVSPTDEMFNLASHAENIKLIEGDMHLIPRDGSVDIVWLHHILEHSFSPMYLLWRVYGALKPHGFVAVVVPLYKDIAVSGHFYSGWNVAQLLYLLAVVGFDVSAGNIWQDKHNVYGLAEKPPYPYNEVESGLIYNLVGRVPQSVVDTVLTRNSLGRYFLRRSG